MNFDKSTKTLYLSDDLSFESVNLLWQDVSKIIRSKEVDFIDCQKVVHTDSAGLAFLLECLYRAGKTSKKLRFLNLPEKMMTLAKAHEVDELFQKNN